MHCWNYSESYIRFQFTETLRKLFIMSQHCWIYIEFPLTGVMTESIWDYTIVSTLLKLYSKFPYIFSSVPVLLKRYFSSSVKNWTLRIISWGFFPLVAQTTTSQYTNTLIWWIYQEEWKSEWKFITILQNWTF